MSARAFPGIVPALLLSACAVTPTPELTDPSPGISRELAAARAAAIEDVHYHLHFEMEKGMPAVRGDCEVRFVLKERQPVVLDFAGQSLSELLVNGEAVVPRQVANHLVLDGCRVGKNKVRAKYLSKVAPTGTPLTVYRDKTDGAEYYYTLVVPADAHRLFPCFDQPDLKARFHLQVTAPSEWKVMANGLDNTARFRVQSPVQTHDFDPTPPLSTYLFAFAAGPFEQLDRAPVQLPDGKTVPLRLFVRASKLDKLERDLLFAMHDKALRWLGDYFAYGYPFGKLDMVLLPGFPYGGMEHAGAIFYRETSLVFDQKPTEGELTRRSTLIYHEVSHQWFGNLVTMEWFDDLWLKEGFATFMGYTLFEILEPGKHAWLRFHHRVKPQAYAVDATTGTTPVYQELANLADAKSAYGAIVYNKAPAILRELNHRLGPATFQKGLQRFLRAHEFGNATWRDLVAALEAAAEESAAPWSSRWILAAGMPRVQARWNVEGDRVTSFEVLQESVQGDAGTWPLQVEVLMLGAGGIHKRVEVVADGARTPVPALLGRPVPACVLLNPGDVAYGQFLLDARSQAWLVDHAQEVQDPLVRAVAMSALWETVREAQLDPSRYAGTALRLLAIETDAGTHAWLLGTLQTALQRYMAQERAAPLVEELATVLRRQLAGETAAIKTQTLRALMAACADAATLALCEEVAAGKSPAPGLEVGKRDRFLAATALLAAGRGRAALDGVVEALADEDVAREAYIAGAADPKAKAEYFAGYANLDEPPEQWMSISLDNFHWPGQEDATLPYLFPALDKVEWVKKNRKIFFMPAWIDAFVNGHSSPAALRAVEGFLAERRDLPVDIRRKILQSLDGLQRAVRIRDRWK